MRYWQSLAYQPVNQLVALARAAEGADFHGVLIPEHLITPATIQSRYPYSDDGVLDIRPELQAPDPWVTIGALAAATRSLHFATNVYLLPLHELFAAAKAISTAACLGNGRVALGVGVGWLREEFELTGQHFAALADGWMSARVSDPDHIVTMTRRINAARESAGTQDQPFQVFAGIAQAPEPDLVEAMRAVGVTDLAISARLSVGDWHAGIADKQRAMGAFGERYRLGDASGST